MGFTVGARTLKIGETGEPYMMSYDDENPFDGTKMVDAEEFIDLCGRFGDNYSTYDYCAPCFYVRPTDHTRISIEIDKFETNAECFQSWLTWLKAHPGVWLEGYH